MKIDPWHNASFTMEIIFDVAILIVALLVGWFGIHIQAPVLAFAAAIFIATSLCWLAADVWRAINSIIGFKGWIIEPPVPELGVTFSWSRNTVSACLYLVRVDLVGTIYRRK